ncbi:hypothetical protein HN51_017747 [Arachis hypogaea]|nr:uncharacterized protein DS421_8g223660 [Arachis hypogaea]
MCVFMGNKKKKRQKTKELSVAIAEASASASSEKGGQHEQIIQPRRKRGRPRKIIVENKIIIQEQNVHESIQQELLEASTATQATAKKDEGEKQLQPFQLQQEGDEDALPPPKARSRARRKSKPRKSA